MKTWDIFCRVIDNYGDIGVCWRLARQLAEEHNLDVRLWVDEIAVLKHIWPETLLITNQTLAGVNVCIWPENFQTDYMADVVIEAFACHLPDVYITQMKLAAVAPCWLNLEYLSAEPWVEGCHKLNSIHPQHGLIKTFFFPGFTDATGGLLREQGLLVQRDNFALQNKKHIFLAKFEVDYKPNNALIISLFSYENLAIASLLTAWEQSPCPIICLVQEGKLLTSINTALNLQLALGDHYVQDSLQIYVIPFLTQTDYDQLLWACDINFVRGEDSFVRAQWAGKPFVWHIYPQEEDAHLIKLSAFLDKYLKDVEPTEGTIIRQLWMDWNTGKDCTQAWRKTLEQHQNWVKHSNEWCENLSSRLDLTTNLLHFCQKKL